LFSQSERLAVVKVVARLVQVAGKVLVKVGVQLAV